ncbi:hypothetical protein [Cupriavidus sp. YAF13]|uniref:hypothetical protein n=1 Tax=Cupriavidus sp. YAF13 TaxID=3233075 RepID=UPI003F8FE830
MTTKGSAGKRAKRRILVRLRTQQATTLPGKHIKHELFQHCTMRGNAGKPPRWLAVMRAGALVKVAEVSCRAPVLALWTKASYDRGIHRPQLAS